MTHEFLHILYKIKHFRSVGKSMVLASVVALDGSSYRRPGVRMLIAEDGSVYGAVSGGCVEREVVERSASVFRHKEAKIITYDGRYRLGCEGVLYILIEFVSLDDRQLDLCIEALEKRQELKIRSYHKREDDYSGDMGSVVVLPDNNTIALSPLHTISNGTLSCFEQVLNPLFRLIIIGAEHDAVKLSAMATLLGWQVEIYSSIKDPKSLSDFPGAQKVHAVAAENFTFEKGDYQTAVVLMTHNYALDLQFLLKFKNKELAYLGMLGSSKRRERLHADLLEYAPELDMEWLDGVFSPAGLNLGAETPEEIALSILSEILSVVNKRSPFSLRELSGAIHS